MSSHVHRLISIVEALTSSERGMSVEQIANLFCVSKKTARRDLVCIKELGCQFEELVGERGKKCYKLADRPKLALQLAFDEALALFVGCHLSPAYRGTGLGQAAESSLHKLRAGLGPRALKYLEAQSPNFYRTVVGGADEGRAALFDTIQIAIEDRTVARLSYRSAERLEAVTYDVHPYGLIEHRGTVYMVGYSTLRDAIRTWKVDRVLSVELTDSAFSVAVDFDLKDYLRDAFAVVCGDHLQRIVVRLEPSAALYVKEKRMHASQRLELHLDGSANVEFRLSSTLEIKSWVLSFGSQAEVLEPLELRDQIAAEAKQLAVLYESQPRPKPNRHPIAPK